MSEVTQLEQQRANNLELMRRRDIAERLAQNPDFKELILKIFMVEECANYAHASANVSLSPADREDAMRFAQASGLLKKWLHVICQMGNNAQGQMEDLDAAILEARQEEDVRS